MRHIVDDWSTFQTFLSASPWVRILKTNPGSLYCYTPGPLLEQGIPVNPAVPSKMEINSLSTMICAAIIKSKSWSTGTVEGALGLQIPCGKLERVVNQLLAE